MKRFIRDFIIALSAAVLAIPVYELIVGKGRSLPHIFAHLWSLASHDNSTSGILIATLIPVGIAVLSSIPTLIDVIGDSRKRTRPARSDHDKYPGSGDGYGRHSGDGNGRSGRNYWD